VSAVDWDRIVFRAVIVSEAPEITEQSADVAMVNAEKWARPRLQLLDESRRVVRVQNAPPDARRHLPWLLKHWHAAAPPSRSGLEPVGKYHDRPNVLDVDYVVPRSAAGDALIALLADEVEPTVVVRRHSIGTDLLTLFEM
jgi:hypothetical protein